MLDKSKYLIFGLLATLRDLGAEEIESTFGVEIKFIDPKRTSESEGTLLI